MVLTVYHYLNVCYYGGQMLNKKNIGQNTFYHIKLRLLQFCTDVTDFDNEQKCTSASKLKLLSDVHF